MSKWTDWNNYENYQCHSDAKASHGAITMAEKATGLSINAFLVFACNNHQPGGVRKWHNTELEIYLRKITYLFDTDYSSLQGDRYLQDLFT